MATQTDTLIYQVIWDDGDAVKGSDAWTKRLKNLEKEAEKAVKRIGDVFGGGGNIDLFGGMLSAGKKAFDGLVGIAKSALNIIFDGFKKLADVTWDVFEGAVSDSISLEDAMAGVRKTAGLTANEVGDLQRQVRDFAVEELNGMVAAEDLAKALEVAGQQGVFAGKSFEEGSADALAFAKTMVIAGDVFGGLNVEKAAEGLGLLHGVFSDSIPDVERLASEINYFGDNTKRSEGFILTLASNLSAAAKSAGLTEHATVALAATLGNIPQVASKSGTAMSRIMNVMSTDTTKFAEIFGLNATEFKRLVQTDMEGAIVMLSQRLQELGQTTAGTQLINDALKDLSLTGQGVSTVMRGLGENAGVLVQNLAIGKEQWDLNTSAMNSFIDGTDRTSKLWEALQNILTNTIGVMSDMLLPVFKSVLKQVNELAAAFREWFTNSELITTTLPNALADINRVIFDLIQSAKEFVLNIDWDGFFQKLSIGFQDLTAFLQNVDWGAAFVTLKDTALAVITFITDTLPGLLSSWSDFTGAIDNTVEILKLVKGAWDSLTAVIGKLFDIAQPGIDLIVAALSAIALALDGEVALAIQQFGTNWTLIVKEVGASLMGLFDGPKKAMESFFSGMVDGAKKAVKAVADVAGKVKDMIPFIKEADKEATGNSLFPDIVTWADKASQSVNAMNSKISNTAAVTSAASAALPTMGQAFLAPQFDDMARKNVFGAQQPKAKAKNNVQRSPRQSTPSTVGQPANRGLTTVVNFNGTNVVDNSSQQRFVRNITKAQRRQNSLTVSGSTA